MTTKKMALLQLTPEALRELLFLPDGVEVVRVEMAHGQRGVVHLMIEGAGWDTSEGGMVQPTGACIVTKEWGADGTLLKQSADWHLPKEAQD